LAFKLINVLFCAVDGIGAIAGRRYHLTELFGAAVSRGKYTGGGCVHIVICNNVTAFVQV